MPDEVDKVDSNDQDLPVNQSTNRTETSDRLNRELPPYTYCSQQSLSDIRCMPLESKDYDQTPPYKQENNHILPTHTIPAQSECFIKITLKRRVFLILFGIGFLLLGAGAIGLEVSIIVYSYTSYLRGIWTGNLMLGTGITFIVISSRTSDSFVGIRYLLFFTFFTNSVGVLCSTMELATTAPCTDEAPFGLCDVAVGRMLKLTIVGVLNFATFYTIAITGYLWMIRPKSASRSRTPPTALDFT